MTNPIYFAPYQVPMVDVKTGIISREWFLLFQAMFDRSGGTNGASNDDLEQLTAEALDISDADQVVQAQLLADARINALDADLTDPPSTDAADALMLLLDSQDSSISNSAGPTAKVGITAVNGSASTFMRSDASPALDVTITVTWTGAHTFTPALGVTIFNGLNGSGAYAAQVRGGTTAGDRGLKVQGGTNAADLSLVVTNAAGTINLFQVTPGAGALFNSGIGLFGASTPAQPTGYGTPTGGAHQASFAAGSITLPNLAAAVAQLIIELKAYGLIGA